MENLTIKELKKMKPGIFATGTISDNANGINMMNTGNLLRWVAVRGGIHDWAIYCDYAEKTEQDVKSWGNKVGDEGNIKKLVPCNDEAFEMYRY